MQIMLNVETEWAGKYNNNNTHIPKKKNWNNFVFDDIVVIFDNHMKFMLRLATTIFDMKLSLVVITRSESNSNESSVIINQITQLRSVECVRDGTIWSRTIRSIFTHVSVVFYPLICQIKCQLALNRHWHNILKSPTEYIQRRIDLNSPSSFNPLNLMSHTQPCFPWC